PRPASPAVYSGAAMRLTLIRLELLASALLLGVALAWSALRGLDLVGAIRPALGPTAMGAGAGLALAATLPLVTAPWATRVLVLPPPHTPCTTCSRSRISADGRSGRTRGAEPAPGTGASFSVMRGGRGERPPGAGTDPAHVRHERIEVVLGADVLVLGHLDRL